MILLAITAASVVYEAAEIYLEFETNGYEVGLMKFGITIFRDIVMSYTRTKLFQVAGKHYSTLRAALTASLEKVPFVKAPLNRYKDRIVKICYQEIGTGSSTSVRRSFKPSTSKFKTNSNKRKLDKINEINLILQ